MNLENFKEDLAMFTNGSIPVTINGCDIVSIEVHKGIVRTERIDMDTGEKIWMETEYLDLS